MQHGQAGIYAYRHLIDMSVYELARKVNDALCENGFTLSTAESCTGGGIAAAITSVPGSSNVFKGGVVAYANEVKNGVLSVTPEALREHGAVSEAVVCEMVCGVARLMQTDCAVATSGIAGPSGGTPEKPVGTVWVAIYIKGIIKTHLLTLDDCGRTVNIQSTIAETLRLLYALLREL